MKTITERHSAPMAGDMETAFAELLAQVLRVDRVPVDSHFFEGLGADSLVMAHFCARVRKRGNLPAVSMRDVYRHPTIRRLSAPLAGAAPPAPKPPVSEGVEAPTPTSAREHVLCGVLQGLFFLAYCYVAVLAISAGYEWVSAGSGALAIYLRLVLASSAAFLALCAVPIAA